MEFSKTFGFFKKIVKEKILKRNCDYLQNIER